MYHKKKVAAVVSECVKYNKDYILNLCEKEMYLFDMRCWNKPRKDITSDDLKSWIMKGCVPNNCGHLQWCINLALEYDLCTVDEMIQSMLKNKTVQHPDEVGSAFEDEGRFFLSFSDKPSFTRLAQEKLNPPSIATIL